ncbi:MAG: hypothetical protein LBM00_08360 [Deltaproteobacteria bacterium]|jgi:diaminopimelate epimerase|nr:hypothetical protein [Deltaproteobacteria bacterium]
MQNLQFLKLNPGGNPTILVTAPQIPVDEHREIAGTLMHPLHLQSEQTGFICLEHAPPRLDMMGQEFCLNAARCLALVMAQANRFLPLDGQDDFFGLISCSGCSQPLQARVKNGNKLSRRGKLAPATPLECFVNLAYRPGDFSLQQTAPGVMLVRLPGICHLLLDENILPAPENTVAAAAGWRSRMNLDKENACGVVWHRQEQSSVYRITPVVYVAATGSSVAESACGSGTLALALALESVQNTTPAKGRNLEIAVLQPSGEALYARLARRHETAAPGTAPAAHESFACTVEIGGQVRLCAKGEAYIQNDGSTL